MSWKNITGHHLGLVALFMGQNFPVIEVIRFLDYSNGCECFHCAFKFVETFHTHFRHSSS